LHTQEVRSARHDDGMFCSGTESDARGPADRAPARVTAPVI